ncbi:hypothetical protein [Oscillatoria sp. FACHB-1406]|uniref:hypothetical protein n=1 Tax=Oscillatoria sp. FACHB-1406 TaxID=2692846 RepID=UPI00168666AF|nr:hypothetical protein [Oscillatoria sp. FACHB-1406]MBD2578421.1 hypothetical protein [Oscillatoria sp. FACHB-1406]
MTLSNHSIRLNPSSIAKILAIIASSIILASIVGQLITYSSGHGSLYGLIPLFNVDLEKNIPTFFSVFLLTSAAVLLGLISLLQRQQKGRDATKWAILAFWFLLLAVDEAWSLHEELVEPIRGALGKESLGIFYFAWVLPGIAIVSIFALFFLKFLLRLPRKTRLAIIAAAGLYLGGTLGMELITGGYADAYGQKNLLYGLLTTLEESFEMAGMILLIYTLLQYLADYFSEIQFQFNKLQSNEPSEISENYIETGE